MKLKNLIKNDIKDSSNRNIIQDVILLVLFITIGTISRTILVGFNVQPFPNFEVIMVLTFLAVIFLRSTVAFFVPLFSMMLSDILIGNPIFVGSQMNKIVLFTYSGFAIIAFVSIFGKKFLHRAHSELKLKNFGFAMGTATLFVLIYDIWTNFGWWYLMYPHTTESFTAVFAAGLPFMIYHLISGIFTFTVIALPLIAFVSTEYKFRIPKTVKNIYKLPAAILVVFLIVLSFSGTAMEVPEKTEIWLENSDETSVKIMLKSGDSMLEDNIVAYNGDTVFDMLNRFCTRNDIHLEYTYYEEYDSVLIDKIGDKSNGDNGKYWQYYTSSYKNGEIPPMTGCDQYKVNNGDWILWRFEIPPWG